MTSLLSSAAGRERSGSDDSAGSPRAPRRPLVLLAVLAGLVAAASTLAAASLVGLVGWFLSDAGAHGAPRDGLAAGAVAWLTAHGSGLEVRGTPVTLVPLGLTLVAAWATWRTAHRLGESLWGHGPDVHRLADGERDWTVPVATGTFALGYAAVTGGVGLVVGDGAVQPGAGRVLLWTLALAVCLGAPAIATGSGRAAVWANRASPVLRHGAATAVSVLVTYLVVSAVVLAGAFLLDFGAAANMVERLRTTPGETVLLAVVALLLLPNAVLYCASYLAGPGFAVGGGTVVSPSLVVLGPLPVFPLLAALPGEGTGGAWTGAALAVPAVVAAVATVRTQRRRPTLRWDHGALRGCGGGIVAGFALTVLAALASGAAGPGRMSEVGPFTADLLVHAVTSFGLGGLLGGVLVTWWQRRTSEPVDGADPA